jgi:methylated-DNA-protein-cysteine methyltransferase related protein
MEILIASLKLISQSSVKIKLNKGKTLKEKKKKDFFNKVYEITKKIPYGKVTTYGHIAEACGIKSAARTVGWALNGCGQDIPAHRVVNRYGALTGKIHFGDPNLMEELLKSEGVEFDKNGCVNLEKHLWIPKRKM